MSTDVSTAKPKREIPVGLIDDARKHVYEAAIRTPLLRLNYDGPAEIYLKLECLQPIGSFKIRGAYNAVRLLPEEQRKRGVWTVSAGNAAQGVALAARKAGVPCKVLVMDTAPVAKLDAARRLGAEIVKASYDQCWQALADRTHPAMSGSFVHPFEDDGFIAGNASAGLEILEDLPDVECIIAAFGGGGLSCGIAAAMKERRAQVKVFAAEPETAAPLARSFAMGSAQKFPDWKASWVDGCGGKIRVSANVGPGTSSVSRIDRVHAGGDQAGAAPSGGAEPCDRRGRGRMCGRGRAQREVRFPKGCVCGQWREHRSGKVRGFGVGGLSLRENNNKGHERKRVIVGGIAFGRRSSAVSCRATLTNLRELFELHYE
jgi:threonine dehydratase